jgi:hypothetical protein
MCASSECWGHCSVHRAVGKQRTSLFWWQLAKIIVMLLSLPSQCGTLPEARPSSRHLDRQVKPLPHTLPCKFRVEESPRENNEGIRCVEKEDDRTRNFGKGVHSPYARGRRRGVALAVAEAPGMRPAGRACGATGEEMRGVLVPAGDRRMAGCAGNAEVDAKREIQRSENQKAVGCWRRALCGADTQRRRLHPRPYS